MLGEPVRGGFPDPAIYALPGIEQLRAHLGGLAPQPPLGRLTGARLTQAGSGTASVSMPASPWLMQLESMEVTMLAVWALKAAIRSGIAPATAIELVACSIHHLRPANPASGGVIARGRVVHTGRGISVAEVSVEDGSGRGVAHGTGSIAVEPMAERPPGRPLRPVEEARYAVPDPYLRPVPVAPSAESLQQLAGLELVQQFVDGTVVSPVGELLGSRVVDVDEGHATMVLTTSDWLSLERGRVASAVLMSLASGSLHCATMTIKPAGQRVAPVHQTAQFLRPVGTDGTDLIARGTVTDWDGRRALASAQIFDAAGRVVARGQQTAIATQPRARRGVAEPERILATVLFSDITGSTRLAESLGDKRWRELLDEHHAIVRRHLDTFRGREVKTTGDGFLATFDSPGRAVQAARAIRDGVRRLDLQVRVGLHTGECELSGADVAGIAVHIASRVQGLAGPGEILVTSTVRDLVTGSGLRFTDRGRQPLKGVEGDWQLFALVE